MMLRVWLCGDLLGSRNWVFWVGIDMGCGGSKLDDLPLVTQCRERKELIKAASEQRYALATAHLSYFRSLRDVGDALCRFVEEELVIGVSTPPDSPVLTLPSEGGKKKKNESENHIFNGSTSTSSMSRLGSSLSQDHSVGANEEEEEEASHLHLSSGSDSELDSSSPSPGHIHIEDSPEVDEPTSYYPPQDGWTYNYNTYYMRKSSTAIPSVFYEEPQPSSVQWGNSPESYSNFPQRGNAGFFGFQMGSPRQGDAYNNQEASPPPAEPPPPPLPNVSAWDFLNPFNMYDNAYGGHYSHSRYGGNGSLSSSPDSKEVREREGIPELEEETEQEPFKEVHKERKVSSEDVKKSSDEGTSRSVPMPNSDHYHQPGKHDIESSGSIDEELIISSPDTTIVSKSAEEESVGKKGGSSEIEESSAQDTELSKLSSLTTLSAHGTRDLQEVVKEIKDEFETASSYGKEVAVMLEVGKLPYHPGDTGLRAIFSRIMYFVASPISSSHLPSGQTVRLASSTMKTAKAYSEDPEKDDNLKSCNLSAILEKLYVWEKKLYKEVKDEERLRIIYEKKCRRLKYLDKRGADSSKIDATQASIKKLLTKINVSIRGIDAISSQIQKLRDEELQPQINELIKGWTRMWKLMLKGHQKQFQAIMESKLHTLRAKTGFQRDSSLRATIELEMELLKWSSRFSDWLNMQKSYVESLNGWLVRCLLQEPEETSDGLAPFSPSRAGAPPVFVICNDWCQAMERIAETAVANTMRDFATNLHQLWEKQDEEQNQRLKAEYLSKDVEKQLRALRTERARMKANPGLIVPSGNGISRLDDLKVDLDLMKKRLEGERVRHKEAIKLVHNAASSSIQAGLVPIFEALANFTSEALRAYEQVRIQKADKGSS